jgi:hypothetical protein
MPFFANVDTFYSILRLVFDRIDKESPQALGGLMSGKMLIRMKFSHPTAEVTLNGRRPKFEAIYGPIKLMPDFDVDLAADTMHKIFLDQLTLAQAMATGLIKVRGPMWKVPLLVDLFHAGRTYYAEALKQQGLL